MNRIYNRIILLSIIAIIIIMRYSLFRKTKIKKILIFNKIVKLINNLNWIYKNNK
jgi:hypothetical protein